jgi:pimeloyl-ACP methyl ester carboxylesterase
VATTEEDPMPRRHVNGVELYYELAGDGDPLVLVHGSWTDHTSWCHVVEGLARSHRVVSYDRRGHSRSERRDEQWTRRDDEDDLAALVEALGLGPAHVVGSSFGAAIALAVAARRPELTRSVVAHEPPVIDIARRGSQLAPLVGPLMASFDAIAVGLREGDAEGAAARFVEEVIAGASTWARLPATTRQLMIANAPTFLDEIGDGCWAAPPLAPPPSVPVLLSEGGRSPAWLRGTVAELAATTHHRAVRYTFVDAGHMPHQTHPDELVRIVRSFLHSNRAVTDRLRRS